MKSYEKAETSRKLDQTKPIYARIDGRGFSKFTKGLRRPFDSGMSLTMTDTVRYLMENTHATFGYTQSDEISLVWLPKENENSSIFFDAKIQKLTSVLAGMTTAAFNHFMRERSMPSTHFDKFPHFDARVFNVPDVHEATNAILWRAQDAARNAVQMVGHDNFSSKQMHKLSIKEVIKKLKEEKGIDFDADFPPFFKYGTMFRWVPTYKKTDTGDIVIRSVVDTLSLDIVNSRHESRLKVFFDA